MLAAEELWQERLLRSGRSVVHGSYHRGQIAAVRREAGFDPPYTDYIHALRQELIA